MLRRPLLVLLLALAAPASATAASIPAGSTLLLSGAPNLLDPLPLRVGTTQSTTESISADGRYVVFSSGSDGLVAGDDDHANNVYRKDTHTGELVLVSRRDGVDGEPVHGECYDPAISNNGARVAFSCDRPLVGGISSDEVQVYVRDVAAGRTFLASRASGDGPAGDRNSVDPAISGNGAYVTFTSYATNLGGGTTQAERVYRREIGGGQATILVSMFGPTSLPGRASSISDDGNKIALVTNSNLPEPGGGNGVDDVYVRNVSQGTLTLASRAVSADGNVGNAASTAPALSGDGLAVAFLSHATNLDGPGGDDDTQPDVYRRVTDTFTTTLISTAPGGAKASSARSPSIDRHGARVAFSTTSSLLAADGNDKEDAYLHTAGGLHLLSRASNASGGQSTENVGYPALSDDGDHAALLADAGDLTPDGEPRHSAVVLRTHSTGTTALVSRPPGTEAFVNLGGQSYAPQLSADGRYAAFVSTAPGLGVPLATSYAVFRRDRVTGEVLLVSRADGAGGAAVSVYPGRPSISADGNRVAFTGVAPGTLGVQVWVRDIATGRTLLASRRTGKDGAPADDFVEHPRLDADGSRVAFQSQAKNLDPADTLGDADIYLRDLAADRTLLVSRAGGAGGAKANGASRGPDIDASGQRVGFVSAGSNLATGDMDGYFDAFVRDVEAATTVLASTGPTGKAALDVQDAGVAIDASGTRLVFTTRSNNLDGPPTGDVKAFVRDLRAGTTVLASRQDGPGGAPVAATEPAISPDGGVVSFATEQGIARRDLTAGRTSTIERDGEFGTSDLSDGGRCLAYHATSTGDAAEVYLRAFADDCGDPRPSGPPAAPGPQQQQPPSARPRAARDVLAPRLTGVKLDRTRIRRGRKANATLRLRASEAGTLAVAIERPTRGRQTGKRKLCTPVSKRPKRGACTAYKRVSSSSTKARAGAGKVVLDQRLRKLKLGRYRLSITLRDAAGNRSAPVTVAFRVVGR